MNKTFEQYDYDEFVKFVERCESEYNPNCIIARSPEHAEAFASWCIENGIEEPRIVVFR